MKMPLNIGEACNAISVVTDQRNMRVAIRQAGKGSIICAAACFICGLLLGPVGLAAGGTVGGVAAMAITKGSFKPVGEIIRNDLTERQRQELVKRVVNAIREIDGSDLASLIPLIMGNIAVQETVIRTVASFISNELRLKIVDW